jgi:hypothetical protein
MEADGRLLERFEFSFERVQRHLQSWLHMHGLLRSDASAPLRVIHAEQTLVVAVRYLEHGTFRQCIEPKLPLNALPFEDPISFNTSRRLGLD